MAKRATRAGTAATGRRRSAAKPKAKAARPARAVSKTQRSSSDSDTAADVLFKLLESPLVADLLAVGATAALAAIAESRYSRRSGADAGSKKALKAAAKAAAGAIGRRLSTEFEEIRKASDKSRARTKV